MSYIVYFFLSYRGFLTEILNELISYLNIAEQSVHICTTKYIDWPIVILSNYDFDPTLSIQSNQRKVSFWKIKEIFIDLYKSYQQKFNIKPYQSIETSNNIPHSFTELNQKNMYL